MKSKRKTRGPYRFSFLGPILVLASLGVPQASASGPTGKIVGTVADNSKAAVVGASVSAVNQETSETHVVQSDGSGDFVFPVLPVGHYTIKVEKTGFSTYEQKDVLLQVDQSVSVLPVLPVGSSTQTVTVEAGTEPTVNLTDATVSHVVDEQRVVDLPLNGRDALQLQYIMPGVSFDTNNVAHGQGQHEGVVVNGNRPGSNYYLLDGVDMTDSYLSVAPTFPAPDALQEFDIQTSNFNAQYGRSSGGLVNVATKAGTNQWHGDLFEFFRNDKLNAHNYFDPAGSPVGHYRLNQFGGTIGGPLQKDKTFIFGYFQEARQRRSSTATINQVLTSSERPDKNGGAANFSDLCASTAAACPVDPLTNAPFPGNVISASRIDPTAVNFITAVMPLPNNSTNGFVYQSPSAGNLDDNNEPQFVVRLDRTFGSTDTTFGRYYFNQDRGTGVTGFPGAPHVKDFRNQNVAIEWTHTFSPKFLNNGTFGFNRMSHYRAPTKSIGWQVYGGPDGQGAPGLPSELFGGINGSIGGGGDGSFRQDRQTYQGSDFVSVIRAKHTLNIGGEYRRESIDRTEDFFSDPVFDFNGQYTTQHDAKGNGISNGTPLADLLLGLPNYFEVDNEVGSELRHNSVDLYVTDNYKVASNLTVDAGLRWEPFLPPVDDLNRQTCLDTTFTKQSSYFPTAPAGLLFAGKDPGCPRQIVPNRMKNVAPRLGINWDPTKSGKMSVRAGFGLFWDQMRLIGYNRFSTAQPFDAAVQNNDPGCGSPNLGVTPCSYVPELTGNAVYMNNGITSPFPFTVPSTSAQRQAFDPLFGGHWPSNALEVGLSPKFNEGYSQEWNLSVQQQLSNDLSLTVGYIGNRSNHLWVSRLYNWAVPNPQQTVSQNQNNLNQRRILSSIQCGTITPGVNAPCYGSVELEDNAAWSTYHGLQIVADKKFNRGLTFMGSYVWGKYLDIRSIGAEGQNGPRDPLDFGLDYGPSDNDVRNRFAISYIWELPSAKMLHGLADTVLNHWQSQGITIAQSGTPFSILSGPDTGLTGIGGDTAAPVQGVSPNIGLHKSGGSVTYLNANAYQNAPYFTFGVLGRNSIVGPKYVNFDFSFFKEFPVFERQKLQFRAESFNLFNHPNFNNPNNTVGGGLGQITGARDPRFIQFAMKYLF